MEIMHNGIEEEREDEVGKNLQIWRPKNSDPSVDDIIISSSYSEEEVEEEVMELEFERAVEKVHTHTFYCPNCFSHITKVVLRRRIRKDAVPSIVCSHRINCSDIDSVGSNPSNVMINGGHNTEQEVDDNGILQLYVHSDNTEEVITLQWSLLGNNLRVEDVDIPELANAVINYLGKVKDGIVSGLNTPTLKRTLREEENICKRVGVDENVKSDLVEESDEEVITLQFERVVEKVLTHTPYCPNCCSQINKVVLRRRKREKRVWSVSTSNHCDRSPDIFRCLSCFSFFIPTGNAFHIFGWKGGSTNAEGSTTIKRVSAWFSSMFASNKAEVHVSQGSDQVKHEGESNNEGDNLEKPGRHPGITPPHPSLPSGDWKIDVGDETDGISGGVTAPTKLESEIAEPSDKSRRRPEHDEESPVKSTTDQHGETDANLAKQAAIYGTSEGMTATSISKTKIREQHSPKSQRLSDGTSEEMTAPSISENKIREQHSPKSQRLPGKDQVKYEGESIDHQYEKRGSLSSLNIKFNLLLRSKLRSTGDHYPLYLLHKSGYGRVRIHF